MTESVGVLIDAYAARRAAEGLRDDPAQRRALDALQQLSDALANVSGQGRPFFWGLLGWRQRMDDAPAHGLYLHGPVGRGKSMMMDLFFAHAPVAQKRRVHYHAFMQDIYARLHHRHAAGVQTSDGLKTVARDVASEISLLCLDEFFVSTIADAMILARLFTALFEEGVTVVFTSNTAPDDLYAGGLQRALFLPFIDILKQNVAIVHVDGADDHRQAHAADARMWVYPLDAAADTFLESRWESLTNHAPKHPHDLTVMGRALTVPAAADRVAWFTADALFGDSDSPKGSADYLALAARYDTFLIADMPRIAPDARNMLARVITFIDAVYDKHGVLIVTAADSVENIYPEGPDIFAWQRARSRLHEMQSFAYAKDL